MSGGSGAAHKLARSGALNFVGLVYYGLANLALVWVVSSQIGPGRAGEVLTTIAVFNIVQRAVLIGADIGLVRTISNWLAIGRRRDVERLWVPVGLPLLTCSLIATAVMWRWAEPLARLVGDRDAALTAQLRAVAPILPCAVAYQALEAASRGFGTFVPSFVVEKVGKVTLQLGLVTTAAVLDARPRYVALAWAAPFVLGSLVMLIWVRRLQHNPAEPPPDVATQQSRGVRVASREFWRFSAARAPAGLFQSAQLWSDSVLVGALAAGGTISAGIYAAGTRFLIVASFVQLAIGQALQPLVSAALARHDDRTSREVFQAATGWTILFTWPVLIGIIGFAPALLRIYGDEYDATAASLVILGFAWMVATGCGPVDNVLLMSGRSILTTINSGIAVALNIGLSFLLIPDHGMLGAAIAWGASLVFNNVTPLLQVRHFLGLVPWGNAARRALVPVAAYAASIGAARLVFGQSLVGATLGAILGLTVFAVLVGRDRAALEISTLASGLRRRNGRTRMATVDSAQPM